MQCGHACFYTAYPAWPWIFARRNASAEALKNQMDQKSKTPSNNIDCTKQTKVSSPRRPAVGRIEALHRRMCTSMKRVTSKRVATVAGLAQLHSTIDSSQQFAPSLFGSRQIWKIAPWLEFCETGTLVPSKHATSWTSFWANPTRHDELQGSHELQLPSKFVRHHGLSVGLQNGDLWQGTKKAAEQYEICVCCDLYPTKRRILLRILEKQAVVASQTLWHVSTLNWSKHIKTVFNSSLVVLKWQRCYLTATAIEA